VLAILGHGKLPTDVRYGEVLTRATEFLGNSQNPDGSFGTFNSSTGPYEQSLATYALSEMYYVTRERTLKSLVEKAVDFILAGQQPGGGWSYGYASGRNRDTFLGGNQIVALHFARMAGIRSDLIPAAIQAGLQDFTTVQDQKSGRIGYQLKNIGSSSITGIGTYCFQLAGLSFTQPALLGIQYLEQTVSDYKASKWPLIGGYYLLQAAYQQGGSIWNDFYGPISREIISKQQKDGSWIGPAKEQYYGTAYATALCVLMLETPFRYPRISRGSLPLTFILSKGAKTSFLMGLPPLRKTDTYVFGDTVQALLNESDTILLESKDTETIRYFKQHAFNSEAFHLKNLIPRNLYSPVRSGLSKAGMSSSYIQRLKPWAAGLILLGLLYEDNEWLTESFFMERKVRQLGFSNIQTLNNPEEILETMNKLPPEVLAAVLTVLTRDKTMLEGFVEEVRDAWRISDVYDLERSLNNFLDHDRIDKQIWAGLLSQQNQDLVQKITDYLSRGNTAFIALPAVRLIGTNGVLNLLRKRQYIVRPFKSADAVTDLLTLKD